MNGTTATAPSKGAFEIIEDAFSLVRHRSLRALASYYIGTLPFVAAILFFWADMSKSAFAQERLPQSAAALAVLFLWMKVWQAIYARELWAEMTGEERPRWTAARALRAIVRQGVIQPLGLILLPLALIVAIPFPWVYAFYQTATVLEDGESAEIMGLTRRAARLAMVWPRQNMFMIWAFSPFLMVVTIAFYAGLIPILSAVTPVWTRGMLAFYSAFYMLILLPMNPLGLVVAVNIGSAILVVPQLLRIFTGMESGLMLSPQAMMNSTFFAVVCGLTYLCMDPLMKAAYVLRVFHAEAVHSGLDLKVALRRLSLVIFAALLLLFTSAAHAADFSSSDQSDRSDLSDQSHQAINPGELSAALDRELQQPPYAWRMPRAESKHAGENALVRLFRWIAEKLEAGWHKLMKWAEKIGDWIDRHWPKRGPGGAPLLSGATALTRLLLYILLACLAAILALLIWRAWMKRHEPTGMITAQVVETVPDLVDENTTADVLPETGWRALAQEAFDRGELRLALRALFLANLAYLSEKGFVRIARFKSNWDYRRELARRAHARPEVLELFSRSATIYESVWYGMHETTRELYESVRATQEELRACVQ